RSLTAGWTGAASFLAWIVSDQWLFLSFALKAGIWLFLLPVLFTVSHRMLPFFSSSVLSNYKVIQPRWSLQLMLVASALHLLLDISHLPQWLFIADIPMAMVALYHTIKWQFKRSFADRLLAVLHMAFLWLGLSMLLFSIQSLYLLVSGELILGKGPLHALTIGFFSALLVAMASRVTMGHSGRMLILDNRSWYLFIGIQLTAVLRIFADINLINSILGLSFNVIASLCWLTCIGVWVSRYAPMYITARVDGRPG
ncbi:MAG: NnrS family protein, partial [Gammaproteobacteria bacterium]|nr:NnrS family protein [Gammaproteobacteria bacterium]